MYSRRRGIHFIFPDTCVQRSWGIQVVELALHTIYSLKPHVSRTNFYSDYRYLALEMSVNLNFRKLSTDISPKHQNEVKTKISVYWSCKLSTLMISNLWSWSCKYRENVSRTMNRIPRGREKESLKVERVFAVCVWLNANPIGSWILSSVRNYYLRYKSGDLLDCLLAPISSASSRYYLGARLHLRSFIFNLYVVRVYMRLYNCACAGRWNVTALFSVYYTHSL